MVFFVGMPLIFGFANYLVPLMIGARDMAFPRLNAFSFWISAFAGPLLYYSFIAGTGPAGTGSAPDVGWFAYAPLTEPAFSPGHTMDYWTVSLLLSGVGSIGTAINILATVFSWYAMQRDDPFRGFHCCPGSTLPSHSSFCSSEPAHRMPDNAEDRPLPGRTFLRYPGRGGSAMLWAHFF